MTEGGLFTSAHSVRNYRKEKTMTRSSINNTGIRPSPYQEEKDIRENKLNPKDTVRVEVLQEKIKIDSKNHEKEKRKITSEKDQTINRLETDNENLKIEVAMKSDKIKQLDIANDKKEFKLQHKENIIKGMRDENENLKQRVEDLHREIKHLESEREKISEKHNQTMSTVEHQSERIKEMEERITALKTELDKVKSEREIYEKKMMEKITMMGDKMEAREKEARCREEERERKMEKREKQREEEAKRRERLREEESIKRERKNSEEAKKNMQRVEEKMEMIMSQLVRSTNSIQQDIKSNARGIPRNDNLVITEAKHFQIQNDNHYYGEHNHVRQPGAVNRGRIQPQTRYSFPATSLQSRRGINPRNLYR
ncbi:golgin subfamily A member 6-like protein 22 [Ostrea edulis]|uniref:golgin subfamily A member 6-like protein 22 n=1 Tax=Ostrea edulis TaxID=37623 RepID=UPI0024AF7110|nr:golgin subfamily A member 6-like protein 22 [Ostrea edulis]